MSIVICGLMLTTQNVNAQKATKMNQNQSTQKSSEVLPEKFALLVRIKAKPGKENEVMAFLKSALPLAKAEDKTLKWYALQIDHSTFGVFDTFETEEGRKAHLAGKIASALMASVPELLAEDPVIEKVDLIATK